MEMGNRCSDKVVRNFNLVSVFWFPFAIFDGGFFFWGVFDGGFFFFWGAFDGGLTYGFCFHVWLRVKTEGGRSPLN